MSKAGAFLLVALASACAEARAQTKYPGVEWVHPVIVGRGATTEVEVRASGDLRWSHTALLEGEDARAEVVPPAATDKPTSSLRVKIEINVDARVGPRDLRLATKDAITTVGRVYVTDLPVVLESSAHASRSTSQPIALPCAVSGRSEGAVELDWYRFEAKANERTSFEILGTRLHETIHKIGRFLPHYDAYLSIFDDEGRELASADDHYFADSFLSFVAPRDGAYHVVVREANYKGSPQYTYALIARRGAQALLTFPLAVAPGETTEVELVGPGLTGEARASVTLLADATIGATTLVRPVVGESPGRELLVLASDLPVRRETEDVGAHSNDSIESAETVELPGALAGRLGAPDDTDTFVFTARKGTRYRFEVFARRLFSALDAELAILDERGVVLATGDDSRNLVGQVIRDSKIEWTAPADSRYAIRLRDLHARGGPEFVYHLECDVSRPDFELSLDPELAMIAPGRRTPIFVRASRRGGHDAEISLEVEGLPEGVEAFVPTIRSGMTDACVVLSVAEGTTPRAAMFRIRGRATRKVEGRDEETLTRLAAPLVEVYQAQRVIGRTAGLAVTARSDISVESEVTELVLRPGETVPIPVRLIRDEVYRSGSVSLWADWRFGRRVFGSSLPPGVSLDERASRLGIVGESVDGLVALKAAANAAPIERVPMVVIGLIPIEFSVFVPFCTKPIFVTVQPKEGGKIALSGGSKP